ncbi:unnamed protein product [Trifolium pratense]|uniref:Uncharacterized protein n=1 Tax=Trifolium pratense TaxID=57577 RepID=A0ACB0J2F6_TRIPR|nr:unnamed protein product [Trifolium pratense]
MQYRRRRCVRPSEEESKHFMKAILPSPIHAKQIRIPDEFITRFGNELSHVAKITVPDGRQWDMEVKKCGNDIFLCNKWQEFAEYYSISYGFYLDFKYEGNSEFNVVIYDTTSLEICYPFKTSSTNGKPNIECPKRAKDAVNGINPKNPSFCSKSFRDNFAYVPAEFAPKYLKLNVPFKLQNSQGKQWEVSCVFNKKGKSMRITTGFRKFARDNNLLKGVIYHFELIKSEPVVVLQVTEAPHTPWQQKCVRSSEEKGVRGFEHFKKAILPSPIHAKQIKIPDNFITIFGNELNNDAKVTVPDGRVWDIELKKRDNDVYFCNNWQQFAEFYSIEYGCYLSFKYEGNSMFSVIIFDATSVEIVYPPFKTNGEPKRKCGRPRKKSRVEMNDATSVEIVYPFKTPSTDGELNTKCPSPGKRSKVETSKSQGQKLKSMSKHASKRAEIAAIEFKPSYPYFRSKICERRYVYVHCGFAAKYLKQNVPIKVQNALGEEWEVFCTPNTFGSSEMRISRGFAYFQRANNLSHGDYCVFELIQKKPVVLKVTMFRTVDYLD